MKWLFVLMIGAALFFPHSSVLAQQAARAPAAVPSPQPSNAIPDTLMFTIGEYSDIQSHLASAAGGRGYNSAIESAKLHLSTIVYAGPNDWTIWINGHPIGPRDEFEAFKVTNISPEFVELVVPLSAQGMRPVRLGTNQTFISNSGITVEGEVK